MRTAFVTEVDLALHRKFTFHRSDALRLLAIARLIVDNSIDLMTLVFELLSVNVFFSNVEINWTIFIPNMKFERQFVRQLRHILKFILPVRLQCAVETSCLLKRVA